MPPVVASRTPKKESDGFTFFGDAFFFKEHGELQLRSDLLDCHVDVCSPEVLVQLSDNFDYQASYGHSWFLTSSLGGILIGHSFPIIHS